MMISLTMTPNGGVYLQSTRNSGSRPWNGVTPRPQAVELGRNIAILAGDLQHAWSVRLLLDSVELGVPRPVVLDLMHRLEVDVTNGLVEGEALDVLFARRPILNFPKRKS